LAEKDCTANDPAWRLNEPHDRQRGRGLATAGFPRQPEPLALPQRETDAVHRLHGAAAHLVIDAQVFDAQDIGADCRRHAHVVALRTRGLAISSRPMLMSMRPTKTSTRRTIGVTHHHQRPRMSALKAIAQ